MKILKHLSTFFFLLRFILTLPFMLLLMLIVDLVGHREDREDNFR